MLLITSPDALFVGGKRSPNIVASLREIAKSHTVVLTSNHAAPSWFEDELGKSGAQFRQEKGRQSGAVVRQIAEEIGVEPQDVLVLASKSEDVQMGKNGGAVLIAAGWSTDHIVRALGIEAADGAALQEIVNLASSWVGKWWFVGDEERYRVRALADLSGFAQSDAQQTFAKRLTTTVKAGGAKLNALLAVTARSILIDDIVEQPNLFWGVYPSSSSDNDDTEVLSDFSHRLRTTLSRVRYAARDNPLFIRHTPSSKRSKGGGGDRTDPSEQILTLHLNPEYQGKLKGRNVIVIDDCTTYGVSFGVAAAFLRAAGCASVTGVGLGKFGNQLRYYEIDINSDPFKPVDEDDFVVSKAEFFDGATDSTSKKELRELLS